MTAPKTKYPIEAFGPELMRALVEGGRRRVIIPFEGDDGVGKRRAHTFQRRIHTLRQRMRQVEHVDYMIAARAKVSLFWGPRAGEQDARFTKWNEDVDGRRGALIIIAPHDSEFADILSKAGISADHITPNQTPIERPPVKDDLDLFLDELQSNKPKEPPQ